MNMLSKSTKEQLMALVEEYANKTMFFSVKYTGPGTANAERKEMLDVKARLEAMIENL